MSPKMSHKPSRKPRVSTILILATLLTLAPSTAPRAEVHELSEGGFSIRLPDPWEVEVDDEGLVYGESPNGATWCELEIMDAEDVAGWVYDDLIEIMEEDYRRFETTENFEGYLNDLYVWGVYGSGVDPEDGETYELTIAVIEDDVEAILFVGGVLPEEQERFAALHEKILSSIVSER